MNKIMYLEFERCIGCRACQAACRECGDHDAKERNYVEYVDFTESRQTFPMLCMQCKDPACARVCPANAIQITDEASCFQQWRKNVSDAATVHSAAHSVFRNLTSRRTKCTNAICAMTELVMISRQCVHLFARVTQSASSTSMKCSNCAENVPK